MTYELIRIYKWSYRQCLNPQDEPRLRYYGVPYVEYSIIDGELNIHQQGVEDFTHDRLKNMRGYDIKGWFGAYNKGGYKVWEDICEIYTMTSHEATAYAKDFIDAHCKDVRAIRFH